ncbi:MAG TPA: flagellar biosynthesis protein FlhA [Thermotogaceae bacterium]|nr:flagellar biosynthesis protein FlhA [Thermotogaceae bacterium]
MYGKYMDVAVSLLIVAIVMLMILPIPTPVLDFLQLLNISISIIIILSTMYVRNALELSSFPTILLVMTLFRLALNVTSTRLILLQGRNFSGKVILTFGDFVVKGDYIVGLIIFLILVIIQFIVITRGAERIAEVAARFTLDAMPGKQMSVDADYNAGLITEEEAQRRRAEIRREADFYGAMDGASKFVRGDAIASIIIVFVNIIGGLIIGSIRHGMNIQEAAQTYTLLTVGDGLVTQIPALLVSTATGIVVSRAASETDLGTSMIRELGRETKVLMLTGAVLVFLSLFTPLPTFLTLIIGLFLMIVSYMSSRAVPKPAPEGPEIPGIGPAPEKGAEAPQPSGAPPMTTPEEVSEIIQSDTLEVEIGYGLIPLADPSQGGDLLERITMVRKQIAYEYGLVLSPIRVRDSILLKPNEYVIKLKGAEIARYELIPNRLLAMNPGAAQKELPGIKTKEPAFGLDAIWIDEGLKDEALKNGYTVVDPPTVFATHLSEIIVRNAHEILGRREMELLIDGLKEKFPRLVEDLIPNILKMHEVRRVLQNLLKERVSIRNLPLIFETLIEYAEKSSDIDYLTEQVRRALKRQITSMVKSEDGVVHAVGIDPTLEKDLINSVKGEGEERYISINPSILRQLVEKISGALEEQMRKGYIPVVICSGSLRLYLRRLLERYIPLINVVAYEEISEGVQLKVDSLINL